MVTSAIRLIKQCSVFRIPPAGAVGSSRRVIQTEKRKRIHVIGAPTVSGYTLVFKFGARCQKGRLLHDLDRNNDPEILLPLRLDELRERYISTFRVNSYFNLIYRKLTGIELTRAVTIARVGEQGLRLLRIKRITIRLRVTGKHTSRSDRRQRLSVPPGRDRFLIDTHV